MTWAPTGQENDAKPCALQGDTFHQETAIPSPPHRDYSGLDFGSRGLEVKGPDFSQAPGSLELVQEGVCGACMCICVMCVRGMGRVSLGDQGPQNICFQSITM